MPKPLKITLAVLGLLFVLLLGGIAVFVATFDANAYKSLAIEQVQQRWQRTLAIPGRIEIAVFPRLGLKLGEVSLSEPRSSETFAAWRSAQLSLALWPLLSQRQVIVDRVALDGLRATLRRDKAGQLNIADLLGAPATAEAPATPASAASAALPIDIAGITIDDAALTYDDQQAKRKLVLSKASLRSGRIAPALPFDASFQGHLAADNPVLDSSVALKGRFSIDTAAQRHGVQDLSLEIGGRVATLSDLKAGLQLPKAELQGQTLRLQKPVLQLQLKAGALALQARLDGSDVDGDLGRQQFTLPTLALAVDATLPPGAPQRALALRAGGRVALDLAKGSLASTLNGQLDQSRFKLEFGMPSFAPAVYRFDAEIDSLNLDRYRSAPVAASAAAPATHASTAPETPLDLSALRALQASGRLRVGTLQVAQLKLTQLRTDLQAGNGQLALNPLALNLYQGSASGSLQLAAAAVPRVALKQTLSGVAVGPLLQDLMGKAQLEGRGNVQLDVSTQGSTVTAMKKALAGSARAELQDGMVKGFNIAQTLRHAKARLAGGGTHAGTASAAESTDFSALSASLHIANGVAHNEDLQLISPLLRAGGSGDIDIGSEQLDYLVKATIVATLQGQGGPELQALRGQTVPVRLKGPFNAIGYSVDFAGMARELAKDKLDGKAEAAKTKAKEKLGEKLKGLFGR